jgi:haloalkane dehalogenase
LTRPAIGNDGGPFRLDSLEAKIADPGEIKIWSHRNRTVRSLARNLIGLEGVESRDRNWFQNLLRAACELERNNAMPNRISAEDTHARRRVNVRDSEMSYVTAGDGDPIVFLHGNPTSSYLWRNVIPHVSDLGWCLAPDLVGMGQSGAAPDGAYRFFDHARYLDAWFDALDLRRNVTLVLHDWGSALGFHWASRHPERVRAIAYMEAMTRPRDWEDLPPSRAPIFRDLRSSKGERMILGENAFIEMLLPKLVVRALTKAEMDAYRLPFIEPESRWPMLVWPRELPIGGEPADVAKIVEDYGQWLLRSPHPKMFINAEPGSLLIGRSRDFCRSWPNQQEVTVRGIHFIQEDSPHEIGASLARFLRQTGAGTEDPGVTSRGIVARCARESSVDRRRLPA